VNLIFILLPFWYLVKSTGLISCQQDAGSFYCKGTSKRVGLMIGRLDVGINSFELPFCPPLFPPGGRSVSGVLSAPEDLGF
jgi:hypothetical protein